MIGFEICDKAERDRILLRAMEKGLMLLPAGESAIRISPPLTITKEQAARGLGILEECL
jgi:4-aminobutyrate aminotransferase